VRIGSNVSINRGVKIIGSYWVKDAEIIIGDNVTIAPSVSIYSAGHDYSKLDLPDTAATVRIFDDVWIGAETIILPGVTIGRGCIIGAGSVVDSDIPDYSIAVRNPVRIVKSREING